MAKVRCEGVSDGPGPSGAVAAVRDLAGRRHAIRVERAFLDAAAGASYLPVGVVHIDPATQAVLIELSHEAETGARRMWVRAAQLAGAAD